MASSILHIQVDDALQAKAAESLAAYGISVPDAVRLMLDRVVADREFSQELRDPSTYSELGHGELAELDCVRVRATIQTSDGVVSSGQLGTIVYRHASGDAFEVEFAEPFATVVTLKASELERAIG